MFSSKNPDLSDKRRCDQCGELKDDVEETFVFFSYKDERVHLCVRCQADLLAKCVNPKTDTIRRWREGYLKMKMGSLAHYYRVRSHPVTRGDVEDFSSGIHEELVHLNQSLRELIDLRERLCRS